MKKYHFKIRLLPVIAFTALVLLMIRAYSYSMDVGYLPDIPLTSDTILGDVFCYIKAQACLIISVWAFLTLGYLLITGKIKIKRTKIYIPMAVYTVSVLVSFAFSQYKSMAWYGGINRFEGTRTILCYIFMLFYTINVVDEIKDMLAIIIPTLISIFIACLIGLTQLLRSDILLSEISKLAIGNGLKLKGEFSPGQVYQTVYNMNYVGMYLALVIPLLIYVIYLGLISYKNDRWIKLFDSKRKYLLVIILCFALLLLIALNVYGADSIGGVIGISAAVLFMVIMLVNDRRAKIILLVASVFLFIGAMTAMYLGGSDRVRSIDYFVTGQGKIETSINGNKLIIEYDRDTRKYELKDSDGNILSMINHKRKDGHYQINDYRFKNKLVLFPFEYEGEAYLDFDAYSEDFFFKMDGDEVLYINPYKVDISLDKIDSVGFKGHLSAGSGRGYIWSRTIPLLKKHILLGSGADTFLLEFPQNDYAGKYSAGYFLTDLIDKPHNMYFQMIVCTGGISCLAFICMIIMFLHRAYKEKDQPLIKVIAAGVFGFLIAGLFNDSSVCIMPIFYGFLGMELGILV